MANAKFIPAATWSALTEIDVVDGENMFPQLAAGTYYPVLSAAPGIVVPQLTAGSIDQTSPTIGTTLTVSGSNATAGASYFWEESDDGETWTEIPDETGETLDTSLVVTAGSEVRRGVSDGVQGPVYTDGVVVSAAAASTAFDLTDTSTTYTVSGNTLTFSNVDIGAEDTDRYILIAVAMRGPDTEDVVCNGVTLTEQVPAGGRPNNQDGTRVAFFWGAVPTGTSVTVTVEAFSAITGAAIAVYRSIGYRVPTGGVDMDWSRSLTHEMTVPTEAGAPVVAGVGTQNDNYSDATVPAAFGTADLGGPEADLESNDMGIVYSLRSAAATGNTQYDFTRSSTRHHVSVIAFEAIP